VIAPRRALLALLAAVLLLLAACAAPLTPGEAPPLSGRLAVSVAAHGAAPARSASTQFELHGNAERGRLVLTSPLGTTIARASWQPGAAEVDTGNGRVERHASLDAMAQALLGEPLPLAALVDWLHGRRFAGAPDTAWERGFEQLGWRVDTSRYAEGFVQADRPAPAPAVSVRARLDASP
jgi:outer membrane lipoprotein LolB